MKSRKSPGNSWPTEIDWVDPGFAPLAETIATAQFFGKTVEAWLTPSYASPARGFVRFNNTHTYDADVDVFVGTIEAS